MRDRAERIESLEALRALAAALVLWGHALDYAGYRGDLSRSFAFGADLFFVLSGYIVSLSAERSVGAIDFLRRRAWRILPLYYAATLLEFLRLGLRGFGWESERLLSSLLFWPLPTWGSQGPGPLLAVGWTLHFEVLFYLWLGVLVAWRPRDFQLGEFRLWAALGPLAFAVVNPMALLFAGGVLVRPLPAWALGVGTLWWGLAAYMGIGEIWNCTVSLSGQVSGQRILYWGFAALLVVGATAGWQRSSWPRWVLYLGRESYAIYLFQHFALIVVAGLVASLRPAGLAQPLMPVVLALGSLGLCLFGSWVVASMWSKYVARVEFSLRRPARLGG